MTLVLTANYTTMRTSSFFISLLYMAVFASSQALACPTRAGFIDFNCDGKFRAVVIGDSIVRGVQDKGSTGSTGGYVLDLSEMNPEATFVNMGDPGVSSKRLFRALKSGLRKGDQKILKLIRNGDLVIIEVGTNDYWDGVSGGVVVKYIKRIIKLISKHYVDTLGIPAPVFVVTTLPPVNRGFQQPFIDAVNQTFLRAKSARFPAHIRFDKLPRNIIGKDALHPHARGYLRMARRVQNYLENKYTSFAGSRRTDADIDGLYDELEPALFHTDPTLQDTDGDSLADGSEILVFNTSALSQDSDGDGVTDADELFQQGTDPNNAADF